jgi:hypothetical protein
MMIDFASTRSCAVRIFLSSVVVALLSSIADRTAVLADAVLALA